jgi:outer membrane biosynthesis protein TonB
MFLRKDRAGSAPGHVWPHDGAIIEVHDDLAEQLLLIPRGGFSIAAAPQPEPEPVHEVAVPEPPQPVLEPEPVEEVKPAAPEPKKIGGRPKLPRDKHGNIIRN